jgi:hypothetical protein
MAAAPSSAGNDDNAVEETEVVMGHPGLRAPGDVSLSKVMGITHFGLHQVRDVVYREREDIEEEWLRLTEWGSLLKELTTFEKEKAIGKQKYVGVTEVLLNRK